MPLLSFENLSIGYESNIVLEGLSFSIEKEGTIINHIYCGVIILGKKLFPFLQQYSILHSGW